MAEFTPPPRFLLAALSKDGSEVAFGGFDGSVSLLDVRLSMGTAGPTNPNCFFASSADLLTTGTFNRRPITSAIPQNGGFW